MHAQVSPMPQTSPADRSASSSPMQQFLRFALDIDMYAIRIDLVREILEVGQMTPLPLMPAFVRGVMNLRGAVVPVIDLGARLELPATTIGRRTCVIIVDIKLPEHDDVQTMGVLVDAVHEVFDTAADQLEAVPRLGTRIEPTYIRSMVRVRGRTTPELDLGVILEQQVLAQLISQHRPSH